MTRIASPSRRDAQRVLLVNPNRMKPGVAPIALDYLAHALRQAGFEVDLLDLCFSSDPAQDIERYFAGAPPLAVAVTLRNSDDCWFASRDFCLSRYQEIIEQIKARTAAPIILGGSGFSVMPEAILAYCGLELGVWGEGEYSLPRLLSRLAQGRDGHDVPGLVYATAGGYHRNRPRYLDLGGTAAPRRDTVDNRRYFEEGGMGSIETKRGCSKACIYCADPVGKGRRVRLRSPDSVADEIEMLLGTGIDHFHLCDSEFNLPPAHAESICLKLVERGLGDKVRWYTYASPAPFTPGLASLMRRAGCAGINFGVDSACDRMLRTLGRDYTAEEVGQTAQVCHRQGLVFMYDLLLGGPGETGESLRETIEAVKRLSPHRVGPSLGVRIFPGTRLAAMVRDQGPLAQNRNLQGTVAGDEGFFAPIFYLSAELGPDPQSYLAELIGGDERFFFTSREGADKNYNYNDNTALVSAIRQGYRGAFWDILRRLAGEAVRLSHDEAKGGAA